MAQAPPFHADHRFDQAKNQSPRSGGSKRVTPMMWGVAVVAIVIMTIWFVTAQ